MPRFYFHTECGSHHHADKEGRDENSIDEAKVRAAATVADLLREGSDKFWGSKPWTMTVADESGLMFFTIEVHGQEAPAARPYDRTRPG